jgi:EmrB/QacA subfamily drug resistance transporter
MVVLDATVVNIALPAAQADLQFSDGDRQWIITAYSLAFGLLLLLGGRLSDLIGRKRAFIIGLLGFALASALGGMADTFGLLVFARALQGAFGALLAPTALAVLTTTFTDPKERGRAFGVFGAIAGAGGAIGLLLGGILTEDLSWRWNLYINDVIAVFAIVGAIFFVHTVARTGPRPKLDVPGTILVSGALFALVYGFAHAETDGWDAPLTWGMLTASAVLMLAFVLWQRRATHLLLPLRIVMDRNRAAAYSSILIAGAGMFGIFLFVTYYLQTTLGYSPIQTGLSFLPMIAMLVLSAQLSTNIFLPRFGPKAMVPIGMLLAMSGMLLLTLLDRDSQYAANVLPALMLLGLDGPRSCRRRSRRRPRRGSGVRGRRFGDGQHIAAGRWLHRHRPAQHARRHGGRGLRRAHAGHPRCARGCGHPQLRHGVLVGCGAFALGAVVAALTFRRKADTQAARDAVAARGRAGTRPLTSRPPATAPPTPSAVSDGARTDRG